MKIGILGAPGAEKSKFARGLSRAMPTKTAVVDNYAQRLQKASGLALGPWASYSENLMIAGMREMERAVKQGDHQITVGTIMDTMTYVMVYSDIIIHSYSRQELANIYHNAQAIVSGLSLWYTETWDYDICFFLPYEPPASADLNQRFSYTLSSAYSQVIDTFYVPNVFELTGTISEKIEIAREIIASFEEHEDPTRTQSVDSPSDEESTVRVSSEDGTSGGDSSIAVSDVPLD